MYTVVLTANPWKKYRFILSEKPYDWQPFNNITNFPNVFVDIIFNMAQSDGAVEHTDCASAEG